MQHLIAWTRRRREQHCDGERGQALVLAAIAMAVLIAIGAYAVDSAEWWTHGHHLQEQADAAALAAAQAWQPSCGTQSSQDQQIANDVAQYDGAGTAVWNYGTGQSNGTATGSYNSQLYPNSNNVVAWINSNTFPSSGGSPSYSGSLTGDPCKDNVLDVKLTEEGVHSILPFENPNVSAEAQVGFYELGVANEIEPFIFQSDTPSYVWVELFDEDDLSGCGVASGNCTSTDVNPSSSSILGWAPLTANGSNWTGSLIPGAPTSSSTPAGTISFSGTGDYAAGLRVIASSVDTANGLPPTCPGEYSGAVTAPGGVTCYDIGPPNATGPSQTDDGALYTRVYDSVNPYNPSTYQTPGQPTSFPGAPNAGNVWFVPASGTPSSSTCGTGPGTNSNFATAANNGSSSEVLCANMTYTSTGGTSISCSQATLTAEDEPSAVTGSNSTVAMSCPSGGPNGVWYSTSAISIGYNSGPTEFGLYWSVKTGNFPVEDNTTSGCSGNSCNQVTGGAGSNCSGSGSGCTCSSSSPCTGSFDGFTASSPEIVQRIFSGANNQQQSSYSRGGPIESLSLTTTSGSAVQSVLEGTSEALNVSLGMVPTFQDDTSTTSAGNPIALNAGDDDFSGEFDCQEPTWGTNASSSPANGDPASFNLDEQWWMEDGCNSSDLGSLTHSPPSEPSPSSSSWYYYSINACGNVATNPNASCGTNQTALPTCGTQSTPSSATSAADCVEGVDDNDITWNVMAALNHKIYGCTNATCSGNTVTCNNYWNTDNTFSNLQKDDTSDPRIVLLPLTYFGALYANAYYDPTPITVPISSFGEFYITGWWGDPCIGASAGGTVTENGVTFTASGDDQPPIDVDAGQDNDIDSGSYSENSSGTSSGSDFSGCTSTSPGYDSAATSASNNTPICSDQGVIMGHFFSASHATVSGLISTGTPCNPNGLSVCIAELEK
jgi:Flp pilus assembly protein TadG